MHRVDEPTFLPRYSTQTSIIWRLAQELHKHDKVKRIAVEKRHPKWRHMHEPAVLLAEKRGIFIWPQIKVTQIKFHAALWFAAGDSPPPPRAANALEESIFAGDFGDFVGLIQLCKRRESIQLHVCLGLMAMRWVYCLNPLSMKLSV